MPQVIQGSPQDVECMQQMILGTGNGTILQANQYRNGTLPIHHPPQIIQPGHDSTMCSREAVSQSAYISLWMYSNQSQVHYHTLTASPQAKVSDSCGIKSL